MKSTFNKGPNYVCSKCYRITCTKLTKLKTERHILSTNISDDNVTDRAASFASIMAELLPEPSIIISPLFMSGMSEKRESENNGLCELNKK